MSGDRVVHMAPPANQVNCLMGELLQWLGDGSLATLTLNREQSVTSWSRYDIGAKVLGIMTLLSSTGANRLYFLVDRNGQVQIEQLKEELLLDSATLVNVIDCKVMHPLIKTLESEVAAYYKDKDHTYGINITDRTNDTWLLILTQQ